MSRECGRSRGLGLESLRVRRHRRSKPGPRCYGPGKPGPKTVRVRPHKRLKPQMRLTNDESAGR